MHHWLNPFALSLILFVTSVSADTIDIVVSADGHVQFSGALGQTLFDDDTDVRTAMSGGSNIATGILEFNLALLPEDAVITSATLLLRTSQIISNTQSTAPVEFYGFTGNGIVETDDQNTAATLLTTETFTVPLPDNTDLEIDFPNVTLLNSVLNDANDNDFFAMRLETINFVTMAVDSLESTDSDATPATLRLSFTGGLLLGDVNGDCNIDLLDVAPFVALIASGTFQAEGDINQDGNVDLLDVNPFIDLLTN